MAEYDILVECQVIIDANNEEEAKNIAIKNIQNCLNPYYIEAYAEGQSVKRGRWIEKSEDYYRQWQDSGRSWDDMPYFITGEHFACGVCFDKYEINAEGVEFWDFCPHCGADMRGEDNG